MPVPLPPHTPTGQTPLPTPPQDPLTLRDISNAREYNWNMRISRESGVATHAGVGHGVVYEAALVAHHASEAVAPAWFAPALAQGLAPLYRMSSKTFNLISGDRRTRPFQIVPFVDGSLPTEHNLPALLDVDAIEALTGQQCTAYLTGYNIPAPHVIAERKRLIRIEIGCAEDD